MKAGLATAKTMSTDATQRDNLAAHFDTLSAYLNRLQNALARAAFFLPAYDHRSAKLAMESMVEELGRCKGDLLPRKTFAFKSRAKVAGTTPATAPPSVAAIPAVATAPSAEAAAILARFAVKDAKYKLSDR